MSIQYSGGTNINNTFTSDGTKGNLQSNVMTQLVNAGWTQATGPATGGALTFTITIASPGVVTYASHGLVAGDMFTPSTSGALPTGLTAGTRYFVKTVLTSSTFTLSTTSGGSVINTTGSQSGTHTAIMSVRMISATTTWSVYTKIHLCDVGGTCLNFGLENMSGSIAGTIGTSAGMFLLPFNTRVYRVVANKYQAFIFSPATTPARSFVAFGTPYIPSFLQGVLTDCGWLSGNGGGTDSTSSLTGILSLRTNISFYGSGVSTPNTHALSNTNMLDIANTGNTVGSLILVRPYSLPLTSYAAGVTGNHWHDSSAIMTEPLIAWASTSSAGEALVRGQLWDAALVMDTFAADTTSTFDSKNWLNLTDNNTTEKCSLLLVIP